MAKGEDIGRITQVGERQVRPPLPAGPAPSAAGGTSLGCFPWTALWTVLGLLIGVASAVFPCPQPRNESGKQTTYIQELSEGRQQVINGQLIYTDARSLKLVAGADPSPFRIKIRGSWRRLGPGEGQAPVSAGAQIGVKLHCSGDGVQCTPLSSARQNVLLKSDRATWMWEVSARKAGNVSMAFTATAYLGGSNVVLVEHRPCPHASRWQRRPATADRFP